MAKTFLAGAATSNITPALGTSVNGSMGRNTARHIHDELHARCLVLDDGQERIALVVCDSCMLPGELLDRAKEEVQGFTDLPTDRIVISATHTHSAAAAVSVFQNDADPEYCEFLTQRIADGVRRAINNLAPARVGWGVGRVENEVFNRRWRMKAEGIEPNPFGQIDQVRMNPPAASDALIEPAGPTDPEVVVLAVTTPRNQPLAVWANYSLHYVGGVGPGDISADYFGFFAERLRGMLRADDHDPRFVAMMTNGTRGDVNNIDFRSRRVSREPYDKIRSTAHRLADEALRVVREMTFHEHASIDFRERRLTIGRRLPRPDEVRRAEAILASADHPGDELRTREEIYARETLLMRDWPPTKPTVVQAMRIGELGIATSPCETFAETGLAIKASSPLRPTCVISLANDYAGYLPTRAQHALGGYETWRARSSFAAVDAEETVRRTATELLEEVARSR